MYLTTAHLKSYAKEYGIIGFSDMKRNELWSILSENVDFIWSVLVDNYYFTQQELELITCINGYKVETLNDCIYARYGYRDLEQFTDSMPTPLEQLFNNYGGK